MYIYIYIYCIYIYIFIRIYIYIYIYICVQCQITLVPIWEYSIIEGVIVYSKCIDWESRVCFLILHGSSLNCYWYHPIRYWVC